MSLEQASEHLRVKTRIGTFEITGDRRAVREVRLAGPARRTAAKTASPALKKCAQQLEKYFSGKLTRFSVPIAPQGTAFQKSVWKALQRVGYGKNESYQNIARVVGRPKAVRAVGTAIGANPLCVVIPCHRIIATGGGLGGYAYGLKRKKWLLDHESAQKVK